MVPWTSVIIWRERINFYHLLLKSRDAYNLERLCESLLLWRRFMILGIPLCSIGEALVRIGPTDSAIGLVENLLRLLKQWSNLFDELLFTAVFLTLSFESLNPL